MTMSERETIEISGECVDRIRAHGVESYPHECCGALLGRDADDAGQPREILDVFPLTNQRDDSPQNRFSVSTRDVIAAERAAEGQGLGVVGWYHSHPDHPARPSEYDREHAWPWYSYIILSVQKRVPMDMRSWRLSDDRTKYDEQQLEEVNQLKEVKD
jgi:proteasome lid subunit RPN8/RPN11